ncbi:MAG: hypothetical protein RSD36_13620 [Terrisporobacter sp.]
MGKNNIQFCADAGSKYCPCHLGHSGDCIKCSLICGGKTCDCKWQGVCVYDLLQHDKIVPVEEREQILCKVLETTEVEENIYHIKIQVPKSIIRNLCEPGAYVFLKDKNKEDSIYNAPISVMDIDEENNILEVIVVPRGVKTKPLVHASEITVKAPYFNGIFGLKEIKSNQDNNCVVVLDGLSQVNSINVIKRLLRNNNHVEIFVNNKDKTLKIVEDKIKEMGVNINYFNLDDDKVLLEDYIIKNKVSFVYSCGLIPYNKSILQLVDSIDKNIKFAIPNNNLICCGEGICGSCTVRLNGCRIKTCKTQVDGRDFLSNL